MNEQKPIQLRSQRRALQRKKKNYKWVSRLGIPLFLILIIAISGFAIKQFFEQQALQEKMDTEKQSLIESNKKLQAQIGFETVESIHEEKNVTEIIYQPKEKEGYPIPDFKEKSKKMMDKMVRKQKPKRPTILIAGLGTESYTEQLGSYHIKIDTYQWRIDKNNFDKVATKKGAPTYMNQKTGQPVTSKELIEEEANLMGIHQVIQQQILDDAKEPKKIIDAVLNLPTLSWNEQMTYTPDELEITLPKNKTGVSKVTLPYDKIRPFIQDDLVNPAVFKEEVPALNSNKKYIALTFDDGPSAATTPQVLEVLAEKEVKSTFFLLGQNVNEYPELVQQIQKEGHEIASHSYSHPQLTALPADQVMKEVRETDKAIFNATGILPRTFRPPYGAVNSDVAKQIGKPVIQWNIDSLDWQTKNKNDIIHMVSQTSNPGGIVLMHDIQESTAHALATVIDNLKAQGYEFVTIEEMFHFSERPLYQYFSLNDSRKV